MSRTTRRLILCALVACALLVPATVLWAAPRRHVHHPMIGLGDDNRTMLTDPRFLALGIRTVRYDMHYDAMSVTDERGPLTAWMEAAHRDHLDVLVTIDHTDRVLWKRARVHVKRHGRWVWVWKRKAFSQTRVLPSPAAYGRAFEAFHHRFPWVRNFVTWDETNFFGEATYDREALVARYYRVLRHDCPRCTILAAEFLDVGRTRAVPIVTWARRFVHDLGYQPGYWGINNYEDANHLVDHSTRALLRAVTGKIWFAETGGIVSRRAHPHASFPQNAAHAAKVDGYVLDRLGSLSPRIQRIYLYEWEAKTRHDSWDSALVSYNDRPRQAYDVVARTLDAWGIRPQCTLSLVPPTCTGLGGGGRPAPGSTGATGTTGATGATGATG